ncbi:MAG: ribosome-associated translation inhibitor RaiA [Anaerolineales bacterium]
MRVQINARQFELTDQMHDYVIKKISKLERYLDVLEEATADLTYAKTARSAADRQVAQLTIRGKGVLLRAEERSDDMQASVDAALEKIVRQIDRYKGRHWDPRGDGRSVADAVAPPGMVEDESEEEPDPIQRRKRFLLAPMDEAEALEQMALLGHENFFVYLDAHTGQVNVLYRRRDDSFGLIETEVG